MVVATIVLSGWVLAVSDAAPGPLLIEGANCHQTSLPAPSQTGPSATPASPGNSATVALTLAVLPAVLVRLDDAGNPTEATTNTGCAPRAGDAFFLALPGVQSQPASPALIAQVLDVTFRGDWAQPGAWHALT